jgi:hypothetical protein
LFTILGLSGCTDDGSTNNEQFKINRFDISPTIKNLGETAVLTWDVSGADMVVIDNGIGIVEYKSSIVVSPKVSTTYTLTAVQDKITINATAFIEVIPLDGETEDASVLVGGTDDQIKVVLVSGGDSYGDGFSISDVEVFVDGFEVSEYDTMVWKVGGQILLGESEVNVWVEGEVCEVGDYSVRVVIMDVVVFDGKVTVGDLGFEDASVLVEGTDDQIKVVLVSGGDSYGDGYNIASDVTIIILGNEVVQYDTIVWKVGGQILLGESYPRVWVEGETCEVGEYHVLVIIMDEVVFDGLITVG